MINIRTTKTRKSWKWLKARFWNCSLFS